MSILGQDGMGTPGATPYSSTVGANVANGGVVPGANDSVGRVTALVSPDLGQFVLAKDYTATVMPDEIVRVTSTGNGGSGGPGYVSRIRCITGTSVALTVQDNPGVDVGGTVIYSGTLSAGEEAVLSAAKVPVINGTRLTWAGSASFDVYTGQEAP